MYAKKMVLGGMALMLFVAAATATRIARDEGNEETDKNDAKPLEARQSDPTKLSLVKDTSAYIPSFIDGMNAGNQGVNPLETLEEFLLFGLPNQTEVKIIAATLGSIIVYVFSYMFMAIVFCGYLMGVITLLILKIMFTGFIPAQVISYDTSAPSARVLEPYSFGNHIDYDAPDMGLFDRTVALVNRGYATGLYLYDLLGNQDCQKLIICQASATFAEEEASEITFKDTMRQVAYKLEDTTGRQGYARSANVGALTGACKHEQQKCPDLSPAFAKMDELLERFGYKFNQQ